MIGQGIITETSTTGGILRSDSLTRADSNTTINPPSDGGSSWVLDNGTEVWGIDANQGYTVLQSGAQDVIVLQAGVADVTVQVTISVVGGLIDAGLVAREADNNNYLLFIYSHGTGLLMYKNVAGVFTQLGSTAVYSISPGDILKFTVSGSSLTGYVNGVSKVTATDSAGSTNTRHGLRTFTDQLTRFTAFSISSP
jgi:hypothetical protein